MRFGCRVFLGMLLLVAGAFFHLGAQEFPIIVYGDPYFYSQNSNSLSNSEANSQFGEAELEIFYTAPEKK